MEGRHSHVDHVKHPFKACEVGLFHQKPNSIHQAREENPWTVRAHSNAVLRARETAVVGMELRREDLGKYTYKTVR